MSVPAIPGPAHREPAGVELDRTSVDGVPGERMMVILRAPGCDFARRTGGCTNCGFWQHLTTDGEPVSSGDLEAQLAAALDRHEAALPGVIELDLFCSGSLLCDLEVPPPARLLLIDLAARRLPGLRAIMIESRPEYITTEVMQPLVEALPAQVRLEVGIGLESADKIIREERIRKGFTLDQYREAAEVLAQSGAALVSYLLLKPMGTAEDEAALDVIKSGRFLAGLARDLGLTSRVALEPTFVPEETELYGEMAAGRYTPPSLWTVLKVAREMSSLGLPVHVGLSSEGLPARQVPSGCPDCTAPLRRALALFNETQDPAVLDAVSCKCQPQL